MSTAQSAPVVIVGAGPVGITAAILLARRGVRSVLLERHRDVYPLPRAVAMDDEIRRILQAVGIHEEFAAVARPAKGLRLMDARHRVMAEFRRDDQHGHHGFPQTTLFDQPVLERLLREALARYPECELRGGVEVMGVEELPEGAGPGRVRVTLHREGRQEAEHLWAEAVLGCDGAGSRTRSAIGAVWEDLHFEECWTVIDVRTTQPVRTWEGVEQICDPEQPGTFMRVGEDRYRWEFRLREGETLDGPDGWERLRRLLAPWTEVPPSEGTGDFAVIRQAQYTFRALLADRWRRGRVFLLGDAAHLTPPFIGQGLCSGMRDAHNLSWKLARVLQQGADERLLDTYQSERKPHARHMIRLAVATGWAMTGGQDRGAALRRGVVGVVCRIPGLSPVVAKRGLAPTLGAGPLVHRNRVAGNRLPGTLCPQPWVRVDGRRMRLDEALGDSFAVLTAVPPTPSLRALADGLGARIVHLRGAGVRPGETAVADDGTLAAWLRAGRADAVLLRPDRTVLDVVPAGGDASRLLHAPAWAPLLCTARSRPSPQSEPEQIAPASELRSTTR
ncbi:bifunctional 3-(3-hydroxy-phenyl)propionate/3-hydroxycinnamic acid hydroxylase [Streptomyces sp. SID5914]|nr:bifunctional 3-(3-hydroxy-phenyl)propionate/3-hydroxycinnamic acid hydroxylase [Streptomyces sp. SID5914]MZG14944.1 bifunctional 3-(3-hydroxy-phenyl)propionate/3-hydroxycinnamic acid hydroxylase [Streptomyces sp. SID5914]